MNFWDFYVLGIIVIYLAAFFIRNLKTYFSIKTSIRGSSAKLTLSLVLSTIIYLITFTNIFMPDFQYLLGKITMLDISLMKYLGYSLLPSSLIIGLLALYEMRNSWRVGIKYDQKTDLITTGIYAISRNPYFLSYDMLFLGIFLIYPSLTLLILSLTLAVVFHFMIKEEEDYLENVQGEDYLSYKKKVGRYFFYF